MKDIVRNRRHIGLRDKLKLGWLVLRENGPAWTALLAAYYSASAVSERASAAMDRMRRARGLPGLNSASLNRAIWDAWDWSEQGEEWTVSEQWKHSLIRSVLDPYVRPGASVLEIGPGGGRWTEVLVGRAGRYVGIDVSESAVEYCRRRFGYVPEASFAVGSGGNLPGIDDDSIDFVWSFDVFVHINAVDVARYLDEFRRVLRGGGIAVIHHGAVGGAAGGWRSDVTADTMASLLRERNFETLACLQGWESDGQEFELGGYDDRISIFRRRPAE